MASLNPAALETLALIDRMGRTTSRELAEARGVHRRSTLIALSRLVTRGLVVGAAYRHVSSSPPSRLFDLTPDGALVLWLEGLLSNRVDLLDATQTTGSVVAVRHWRQLGVPWETVEFITRRGRKAWYRSLRQVGGQDANMARL